MDRVWYRMGASKMDLKRKEETRMEERYERGKEEGRAERKE